MHGITRCPQCHTAFNVVSSQLSRAKGKVRCGVCKHTFIASAYWVIAEPDEAELTFDRPAISLQNKPHPSSNKLFLSIIVVSGLVMSLLQLSHFHPSIFQYAPWLEPHRQFIYRTLGMQAPEALPWEDLRLDHYLAKTSSDGIQFQGIINHHGNTISANPDLKLTLRLANGEIHHARIAAQQIEYTEDRLQPKHKTSFSFSINTPPERVDTFELALCCQQKIDQN